MIAIGTMKSKYEGRDIIPVLIVGGIYGMLFALMIRETVWNCKRAETDDLINQVIRIARKNRANDEKENIEEKNEREKSGTKGR